LPELSISYISRMTASLRRLGRESCIAGMLITGWVALGRSCCV
jgi:hypothetical protein